MFTDKNKKVLPEIRRESNGSYNSNPDLNNSIANLNNNLTPTTFYSQSNNNNMEAIKRNSRDTKNK